MKINVAIIALIALGVLVTFIVIILSLFGKELNQFPAPMIQSSPQAQATTTTAVLGMQTKSADCVAAHSLPDAACTPGAVFAGTTTQQVCTPGYASLVRSVSQGVKDTVYAQYGIATRNPGQYEVDHLVSLELGGSNEIANLWPEPAKPRPGFHEKDKVENYLHNQVCSAKMSLPDAQKAISSNWLSTYQSMP